MKLSKSIAFLASIAAAGCIAFAQPASAQCIPVGPFPANWLTTQENAGGHTIARHVGLTDQQLVNRLTNEPNLNAASTYTSLPVAHAAITNALAGVAAAINQWAAGANPGATRADNFGPTAAPVGRRAVQPPNLANIANRNTFRTVVRATGGGNCFLLTSFPT